MKSGKARSSRRYPEPVVGAFILDIDNRILLVKSHKWTDNVWIVPGGHIELGETIGEAVHREVQEEVGLDIRLTDVFAVWDAVFPKNFMRKKHFIFIECECRLTCEQTVRLDGNEIEQFRWVPLDEGLQLPLEMNTGKSLQILIRKYGQSKNGATE